MPMNKETPNQSIINHNTLRAYADAPDLLTQCSLLQLRQLHAQVQAVRKPTHTPSPLPNSKTLIIRELAYLLQDSRLSKQGQQLLKKAIAQAQLYKQTHTSQQSLKQKANNKRTKKPAQPSTVKQPVTLTEGMTLKRTWRGHLYEVTVMANQRFLYEGVEYQSLSQVAKVITGAHWSGPRFFGLT